MRWLLLIAAGLLFAQAASADDTTRAVQEALRTRQLYYGDVDGVAGAVTAAAIRKFQEKEGFDPTGQPDDTTLRALGVTRRGATQPVEEARDFIERYLHACQANDAAQELTFYADRIDYLSDGPVTRTALGPELAAYRAHWPARIYHLLHCIASPSPASADDLIVTYRDQYDVRDGGSHEHTGTEDLRAIIHSAAGRLEIVSIKSL